MTSAFGDLTVIANPNGSGGVRTQLPGLEAALRERGLPYTLHVAERGEEATVAAARYHDLQRIWGRVRRIEDDHQVQLCRELEDGFATPVYHWAEGTPLDDVLAETEMAPGDFVRSCKQLIDLLRQIEDVAAPATASLVRRAREAVHRGVVAYTGV